MDKGAPNMDHTRRHSTSNNESEPTGPKVLSRYLRGSVGSCHDNCKPAVNNTTETKPINPFPKKHSTPTVEKTHIDTGSSSVQRLRKVFSTIPKPNTQDSRTNVNGVKEESSKRKAKKDDSVEPKGQDPKQKSDATQAKMTPLPSPRIPRRRFSDVGVPVGTSLKPPSKTTRRRHSDVVPSRDVGSVFNTSPVRKDFSSRKIESRKDSKPSSVNKNPNVVKSSVPSQKTPANGKSPSASKTQNSVSKPVEKTRNSVSKPVEKTQNSLGSQKTASASTPTKPVEEHVPEKTLYVIPHGNGEEASKTTQTPTSPDEKASRNGHPEPQTTDELNNNEEDSKTSKRRGKLAVENGDCGPERLRFSRGKAISHSESLGPRKLQFREAKFLDEDQSDELDSKLRLRRLSSDGLLQTSESQMLEISLKHQDTKENKDQKVLFNNVIEETASKLIQARKSKVKALVGAFENVFTSTDNN